MLKKLTFGALIAAMMATGAQAATLSASGPVTINRGNGFTPVSGTVTVNPGDRILVRNGGSAQLTYNATCVTSLQQNQMTIVRNTAPCSGMNNSGQVGSVDPTYIFVGAAVVAGVGAAVVLSKDDKRRVSP